MPARTYRPSLYVHVPFCVGRCSYCDFHSGPLSERAAESWLDALRRHLDALLSRFHPAGFDTVYIGGGTPSCLPPAAFDALCSLILSPAAAPPLEFTVEANTEDLSRELLDRLSASGAGRLSLGVQTLQPLPRRRARRRGGEEAARRALELAASSWPGRLSADMIYGLPGQDAAGLAGDLRYLSSLGIGHISLYELTLSPGSAMAAEAAAGGYGLPGEDERHEHYLAAKSALADAGYERYEVSNWSLPGQRCVHNGRYWNMDDWLALGPSGSANLRTPGGYLRIDNSDDDAAYEADPAGSAHETRVSGHTAAFETLMMALRRSEGLDLGDFAARFGQAALEAASRACSRFPDLVSAADGRIAPSDAGMDTLNRVLLACMEELSPGAEER